MRGFRRTIFLSLIVVAGCSNGDALERAAADRRVAEERAQAAEGTLKNLKRDLAAAERRAGAADKTVTDTQGTLDATRKRVAELERELARANAGIRATPALPEGTWKAASMEYSGMKLDPDIVLTTAGNMFILSNVVDNGAFKTHQIIRLTYRLHPGTNPQAIDFTLLENDTTKEVLGICAIEEDKLTTCVSAPGKARPASFSTARGTDTTLTVYRRVSPRKGKT
jgi:uncharacterized protein (TIGR03067 family)